MMLTASNFNLKFELYGEPAKALKTYINILLPLIILRWTWIVADDLLLSGVTTPWIFAKNTILLLFAVFALFAARRLDGAGQMVNLIFLAYWMVSSIAELIYGLASMVASNNTSATPEPATYSDALMSAAMGCAASAITAGLAFVIVVEILAVVVTVVFCIAYIACFIKHTRLFLKTLEQLKNE